MSEAIVLVRWPAMGEMVSFISDASLSEEEKHALEIMNLDTKTESAAVIRSDPHALVFEGKETGLWTLLQEICRRKGYGIMVDASRIPFLQLTQKLSSIGDKNPYEMDCRGCLMAVTADGKRLADELCSAGIPAVVIGKLTAPGGPILIRMNTQTICLEPNAEK